MVSMHPSRPPAVGSRQVAAGVDEAWGPIAGARAGGDVPTPAVAATAADEERPSGRPALEDRVDVQLVEAARVALDLIAGKWVITVLAALNAGPRRRGQLRQALGPALAGMRLHEKVLTETLRRMEAAGLVERTATDEMPPAVLYRLTPMGRSLLQPVGDLARWTRMHYDPPAT